QVRTPRLAQLCFSSIVPPPPPTLFPYTTLFRSTAARSSVRRRSLSAASTWPSVTSSADQDARVSTTGCATRVRPAASTRPPQLVDRKSTRLNSSHSQISYAVFCLKKKNIKKQTS